MVFSEPETGRSRCAQPRERLCLAKTWLCTRYVTVQSPTWSARGFLLLSVGQPADQRQNDGGHYGHPDRTKRLKHFAVETMTGRKGRSGRWPNPKVDPYNTSALLHPETCSLNFEVSAELTRGAQHPFTWPVERVVMVNTIAFFDDLGVVVDYLQSTSGSTRLCGTTNALFNLRPSEAQQNCQGRETQVV